MRRLLEFAILALVMFASAALAPASHAAGERVALVIGNGAYRSVPALPNPTNDSGDIAASLSRLGFSVRRLDDGSFDQMRRALLDFGRSARGAEMAVIFYAGHGMEVGGENWLIPVDAELKSDADIDQEAIGLRSVMGTVDGATKLGLVILDACRNNPFAAKMQRSVRTRAVPRGFAQVEPTGNVLVAYAAKDGTTAADGSGRNSPFTTALLRHIERPGLEVNFLFRHVRDEVMTATQRVQQPFVYGSLSRDEIYFKGGAASPSAAATAPKVEFTAIQPHSPPRQEPVRTPRPRAANEVCATLRGATGTDNYCASSMLSGQLGNTYGVRNLFSNSNAEAWVEGKPGQGVGEWVTIEFPEVRLVKALIIRNGYQKNRDIFEKNSRVRTLRLVFSGGETQRLPLRDSMDQQTITLDRPVRAQWVQFVIDDVYPGSRYTDTAITKLFVTADPAR